MSVEKRRIPFDEFAKDVAGFFERIVRGNETLLVEKMEGELIMLKVASTRRPTKVRRSRRSPANREAFLSTAGGWKDLVDTDRLIENIYESRSISSRPPIQL
ncbi:MAG: hypothetical protein QOH93_305 [Chloroflexia bacterium]|jgi:hypothetical protein|nr:hypothetical protein [Chloroflexia bacterium]